MKSLKKIFESLLKKQPVGGEPMGGAMPPVTGAPPVGGAGMDSMGMAGQIGPLQKKKVLDFPNKEFTVSLMPSEKKAIFTPKRVLFKPSNIRSVINQIKNAFQSDVEEVKEEADNIFTIKFRPSVNFGKVSDTIQQIVDDL